MTTSVFAIIANVIALNINKVYIRISTKHRVHYTMIQFIIPHQLLNTHEERVQTYFPVDASYNFLGTGTLADLRGKGSPSSGAGGVGEQDGMLLESPFWTVASPSDVSEA